ncbi:hypothetical protein BGZ63DRAFT_468689 [Mariannaea sp. PMI_226]|nr:hypothetical protein BGZ63DRAFT_468689 [Mariannaea sp. PMI_226]
MAPLRAKSTGLGLILTVALGLLFCILVVPAQATPSSPSASPPADVDLICHTDDPKECYPRIFQPTDEFQVLHDDQEAPKGLHVRLNISTGKKEAKINVPDEVDSALEGLPVDRSIVVVDPQEPEEPVIPIPKGAPKYEAVGKIKEPDHPHEGSLFFEAMALLKSGKGHDGEAFDKALEGMEELSHDIFYGLKITEDPAVLKSLFCLLTDQDASSSDGFVPRDQQAAAILAGALQNNPTALKEVTKEWAKIMGFRCPRNSRPLSEGFYASFMPSDIPTGDGAKRLIGKAKSKVAAINGLLRSDTIRAEFLENGGMRNLLEVLIPEGKEWATAQRKVGQLVLDTFLDEDMGATLGQWPHSPRFSDDECRAGNGQAAEGCWDYHVERIMKANKRDSGHWSKDLHDRLRKPRACSRCHAVYYCDAACQTAAWSAVHAKECKVLRRLASQGRPALPTPVRAVMQALLKTTIGDGLAVLEGNVEAWRERSEGWRDMEMMAMGAAAFAGLGTEQETVQKAVDILCKIQTNAFHRYDADLGQVGIFLEPTLAMVNHSCIPNAMVQFVGRKAILRAETPIEAGDEIEISYTDYTFPLSKRREALSPYNFTCDIYQVCAISPNIELNRGTLAHDITKLRNPLANKHSEELASLIDSKDPTASLEQRRRDLVARYQSLWAVSPLPQILAEIPIYYAEKGNFMYALMTACFVAVNCDPYRHLAPFHPVRVKGLFLIAKLLANTAADTVTLDDSIKTMVAKGSFNQRSVQALKEIDQVSLCQMLLLMVLQQTPTGYDDEWELSVAAAEMLGDIGRLPGREQELSLIHAWKKDPNNDRSQAFFEYAVVKQIDVLASLGHDALQLEFSQQENW